MSFKKIQSFSLKTHFILENFSPNFKINNYSKILNYQILTILDFNSKKNETFSIKTYASQTSKLFKTSRPTTCSR